MRKAGKQRSLFMGSLQGGDFKINTKLATGLTSSPHAWVVAKQRRYNFTRDT